MCGFQACSFHWLLLFLILKCCQHPCLYFCSALFRKFFRYGLQYYGMITRQYIGGLLKVSVKRKVKWYEETRGVVCHGIFCCKILLTFVKLGCKLKRGLYPATKAKRERVQLKIHTIHKYKYIYIYMLLYLYIYLWKYIYGYIYIFISIAQK